MTEEAELEGGETSEGPASADPAAISIALGRSSSRAAAAVDEEAAGFLRDQRRLINLQAEHLHEQRELQLTHLRVRRWRDRMSLLLQRLAVLAGAVIAIGFAAMAWRAPALPFAFTDWGAERLTHGDTDGAITVLQRAHEVGPHFADPLEMMGEALMRKGDYRGAVAKFRSADEAAPQWGANHLHLGQALLQIGNKREAKEQFDKARSLRAISAVRS